MAEEQAWAPGRHRGKWRNILTAIVACATGVTTTFAQVQVGTYFPLDIETPRDYPGVAAGSEAQTGWFHILSHPGATYVSVHFVDFDLGPGDVLVVQDPQGGQRYELSGKGKMQAGTFWARHIKGDTAVLELLVSSTSGGRGFQMDAYAAGHVDLDAGIIEGICGDDDRANAVCYAESHPVEYNTCQAVARLLIGGSTGCTGSVVSPYNHVLTNNHCITNPTDALNTDFDFMAEAPKCDLPNCGLCYSGDVYSGSVLVQANTGLDYSLVLHHGRRSCRSVRPSGDRQPPARRWRSNLQCPAFRRDGQDDGHLQFRSAGRGRTQPYRHAVGARVPHAVRAGRGRLLP